MRSKKIKIVKNKTKKNKTYFKPSIKILKKGFPIFASKKSYGDKILEYTKQQENKYHNSCLFGNMSWFGDLKQAKSYKTQEQNIYKWEIKTPTNLLIMNKQNENFFDYYFNNTNAILKPTIELSVEQITKIKKMLKELNINTPYLDMTKNERAYFEFKFAYGYIDVEEQYQFMKLVKFFIEKNFIDIKLREGSSIVNKLKIKINYYYLLNKTNYKKKYNRLSIYFFDKYALTNLCKVIPKHYKIDGVFVQNDESFWFPNALVYKTDIKEYVLYNPHHNLIYDSIVE
jgi:hypothetical protein